MIVDEKGRLFGKINLLDILIGIIIICVILAVAYKLNNSKVITQFTKQDKITTIFVLDEILSETARTLNEGESVKDRVTGATFGRVKSIEIKPSIIFFQNSAGEAVKTTKEGYNSLVITVEGQGVYTNNGVTFTNNDYYINKSLEIRVDNTSLYARILNMTIAKEK